MKGKVTGADLGQNSFQFRFELEEDLLTVLAARPFHYAHWMVVLQRWEPIISPTFPSQIPFWIRLHGIPLHYWDDKVLTEIGQDLGTLETYSISKTSTKIRVLIDAFKPLVKETIMEFASGEDLMITLDYDGLENHCSICNSLTHWKDACPERGLNQGIDQAAELRDPRSNRYISPPRPARREPIHSQQNRANYRTNGDEEFNKRVDRHGRPFGDRLPLPERQSQPLRNKITPRYNGSNNRERGETHLQNQNRSRQRSPNLQWRERRSVVTEPTSPRREENREIENLNSDGRPPLERNLATTDFPPPIIPSPEAVMREL